MKGFYKPALYAFLVALAAACVWVSTQSHRVAAAPMPAAQSTSSSMNMNSTNMIDGSVHPELIPDSTAYRLWLVTVSNAPSGSPRQLAHLRAAGLSDTDMVVASNILSNFKAQYAQLVADYNAGATANPDTDYGLASFLANRATLVQNVRDNLKASLTADGMTHLDTHIQSEKSRMRIAKGDQ